MKALLQIENQLRATEGRPKVKLVITLACSAAASNDMFAEILDKAIKTTDVTIHGNTEEAAALLGANQTSSSLDDIIIGQLQASCKTEHSTKIVITNGAKNVVVINANKSQEFAINPVEETKIVNTVGAGDNFTIGYQIGAVMGLSDELCVHLGDLLASIAIQQKEPRLDGNKTKQVAISGGKTVNITGPLANIPDSRRATQIIEGIVRAVCKAVNPISY